MTEKQEGWKKMATFVEYGLNDSQIEFISQKTPKHLTKKRKGRGGKEFTYMPHNFVVERLNQAFNHQWSFEVEVVKQLCNENEMTVKGRLTVITTNNAQIVKEQFGQQDVLKNKSGNSIMTLGDALKGAGSDALKKCASLLGIAIDLYGEEHDIQFELSEQAYKRLMNDIDLFDNDNDLVQWYRDNKPDISNLIGEHFSGFVFAFEKKRLNYFDTVQMKEWYRKDSARLQKILTREQWVELIAFCKDRKATLQNVA